MDMMGPANVYRLRGIVFSAAAVILFMLSAAGCGGSGGGEPQPPGVLKGTVTIGPLCPVEPCNISPDQLAAVYAARKVIVYNSDRTAEVKEVSLDQNGGYSTELEPGQYIVDINHAGIDHSPDVPRTVTIVSGQTVTVDISIDTGIR